MCEEIVDKYEMLVFQIDWVLDEVIIKYDTIAIRNPTNYIYSQ